MSKSTRERLDEAVRLFATHVAAGEWRLADVEAARAFRLRYILRYEADLSRVPDDREERP